MARDLEKWTLFSMSSLGTCYSGLSSKTAEDFGSGNSHYIPFLNVLNNYVIDVDKLESVYVSKSEYQNSVNRGDLFFNTSSETPEEVGMCAVLNDELEDTYLNSFCFGFRMFNFKANPKYLSYFFNSSLGRDKIKAYAQGSTRFNLSKNSFMKIQIPLPPLEEQQAIVEVLESFDEHICNLKNLIEKKRAIREGALQDLMRGRVRVGGFSGEWKSARLIDICDVFDGTHQTPLYVSKGIKFISVENIGAIYASEKYISQEAFNAEFKVIPQRGDILMTRIGDIGTPCFVETNEELAYYVSLALFKNIKIDSSFLYQYIKCVDFQKELNDRTLHHATPIKINKGEIGNCLISFPADFKEQQAIAEILTSMDDEIECLEAEKDKYEQMREGAADDLLSGKVRVNL